MRSAIDQPSNPEAVIQASSVASQPLQLPLVEPRVHTSTPSRPKPQAHALIPAVNRKRDEVADQNPQQPLSAPSPSDHPPTPQYPSNPSNTVLSAPNTEQNDSSTSSSTEPYSQQPSTDLFSARRPIIGRRRRASDDSIDRASSQSELPEAGTSHIVPTDTSGRKRRRVEDTMLADAERSAASNGTSKPYASTKSQQRLPATGTANGTHKSLNGSSKPRPSGPYFGHDREEVTRILIQALSDMGYHSAAQSLSNDSGFELESPIVADFKSAVLDGVWSEAEKLLFGGTASSDRAIEDGNGLILANGADRNMMRLWIRQQKFLELLEQGQTPKALTVLRTEITPLSPDKKKLHFLSSLIMCQTTDELKSNAEWDGAQGQSRRILLSQLSRCISPSVMLPEHRLASLLRQVKENQITRCLWHSNSTSPSLYADHICDRRQFPTENVIELDDHAGEVWQIVFSHDGTRLASCGSDNQVIIWEVPSFRLLHSLKGHEEGVGNVAWSWDGAMLVTCGRDRYARLWDAHTGECLKKLDKFQEPVSSCVWAADNRTFITGSLEKNHSLVQWNLSGEKVFDWNSNHRVEDLAHSPDGRWLVAMDDQNHIHVYNFITRKFDYKMDLHVRLTSISIGQNSRHLLVNYRNGLAQLFDLVVREAVQSYTGHTGGNFMIRSSFGGADESFVISGSEDGFINIWHKASSQPVAKLNGHTPRCNAATWSPIDPCLFASCGDDGKIKIWANNDWRRTHHATMYPNSEASRTANVS
ncbi:WD40 repeat-like protein [Xylariaceae sp. FL0662B]|nr:WD40 repeat-like protein [Xylariaceae sp. FL0662B]